MGTRPAGSDNATGFQAWLGTASRYHQYSFDVLAVIALRPGQPEGALLEGRIASVPQRQAQAEPLLDVAEPGQPVLAPPVGPGPGLVVR
jgi:hypothetical protein